MYEKIYKMWLPETEEWAIGNEYNQAWCGLTDNEQLADFICAAVNSCIQINPEHPEAVAEGMEGVVELLREISEGKGAYSLDHLKHAENTIENMKGLAVEALAKIGGK